MKATLLLAVAIAAGLSLAGEWSLLSTIKWIVVAAVTLALAMWTWVKSSRVDKKMALVRSSLGIVVLMFISLAANWSILAAWVWFVVGVLAFIILIIATSPKKRARPTTR